MKIEVMLKDPDTMHDAVDEAMKGCVKPDGITAIEWKSICEARADKIKSSISDSWMEYGEYLSVVFDVDDDGNAVSAKVVPL